MLQNNQKEIILLKDLGMQYATKKSKSMKYYSLYKCPYCGDEFKAITYDIKRRNINKCLKCSYSIDRAKHNLHKHRLYRIMNNMKNRCYNKNNKDYCNYGERGIHICNEWLNDFMVFYNWALENGYKDDLTIDRKNNDLGYSPDNCRWASKSVQSRNTRVLYKHNKSGFRGITIKKRKEKNVYESSIKINGKNKYLGTFLTIEEAIKERNKYIDNNKLEHTKNI